jgi:hypothetical protein
VVSRIEQAERRREQRERVRALVEQLAALLAGRRTRAEVHAWIRGLWPPGSGQGGPFAWSEAAAVFDSMWHLEATWGDGPLVRDVELRAYLRWLREGECFEADEDPLCTLARELAAFAAWTGTGAVRWWRTGVGWCVSTRFCTPGGGRPFVAHATLERPAGMGILKRRSDDWTEAALDLFEALAIDDADVATLHPAVDLARMPVWALCRQDDHGNRFEMARLRSHAKAWAQAQAYTARGHRQVYWVEPG